MLVIAFNHARFVEQCLDSCFAQTLPARVLVIDDASPDGTADVVAAYSSRTGRELTLVRHPVNRGLGPSLAEGLAMVETEFLAYLAADDWIEPERCAVQVAALRAGGPGCALSYSDVFRADEDGTPIPGVLSTGMGAAWQPGVEDLFAALIEDNWIPAPSVMVRTDALRRVGGYDPGLFYEDHDVALRLAREHTFAFVEPPIATHRELVGSLGNRMFLQEANRPEWLRARVRLYGKHLGFRADLDGRIATMIRAWVLTLYAAGEPPHWVAGELARLLPFLPAELRHTTRGYVALARARVPGSAVARLRALRHR